MPLHIAALLLCALFVAFGIAVVNKAAEKSKLSKEITTFSESINRAQQANDQLALEVAAARDDERIRYLAENNLEMVDASSVKAVPVVVPETRPQQAAQTAQAGSWDGMISGSR